MTGISVGEYVNHTTTGIVELNGMITYRVYVDCTNALDEVSAVYGDATSPLTLISTAGFYQNGFGEPYGWSINPAFFAAFPSLEYDSWVTIGAEDNLVVWNPQFGGTRYGELSRPEVIWLLTKQMEVLGSRSMEMLLRRRGMISKC